MKKTAECGSNDLLKYTIKLALVYNLRPLRSATIQSPHDRNGKEGDDDQHKAE